MNKKWHFFGINNSIAQSVKQKLGDAQALCYEINEIRQENIDNWLKSLTFEKDTKHIILYSWGVLTPKKFFEQSHEELNLSFLINSILPIKIIEKINNLDCEFRMLYISSESAKKGSHDGAYFVTKASVEKYIKEVRLKNIKSSINALAPSMILDAGMTTRRNDQDNVKKIAQHHPKERLLLSEEVAATSFWLLNDSSDYITNTIIEINGGKFTRML